MNLQDVAPQPLKPLEMTHDTRWMEVLMVKPSARVVPMPPIASHGEWRTSIAVRPEQVLAAEELLSRRYAWRGYPAPRGQCNPGSDEVDVPVMLLAERAGKLMGTLTVRPDSAQGLLAEQTYGDEIGQLRCKGRRLGELGKLALEEGVDWKAALDALVQSAYLVARVMHRLTDVVIEVNPRHARFYQRVFGFAVAADERMCERVCAPSVLLHLETEHFGRKLQLAA